jgi:hypothetical protein
MPVQRRPRRGTAKESIPDKSRRGGPEVGSDIISCHAATGTLGKGGKV